ncbi:hypothetical protein PF010_g29435 [Phytophthora fragariae]|uniref:Uncharacterized protein n=1 Tax=Phytophthora fragariae TaxID=53985 RepID=A0A6A3VBJ5_9STRA|nr:hypothetical protein PF009_g31530 [Phytophthora fragariae]KAE9059958.1 hypothetical protein PF007_g30776 [Phytophthora fragariae]KAE9061969.1 hypothetical protein PF006_g31271 [Phytophthora fragariae]KAE9062360.1 hypothetical protein PF010_g29435 [Phytophthora fragariae]KAE9164514.1 hypothetical protein PF002_g31580 [Phytophthora fragariae]
MVLMVPLSKGKTALMDVIADRKAGGKIRGQILPNDHPTTDIATTIILRGQSWSTSCRSGLSDHQPLSCSDGKLCVSDTKGFTT